MEDVRDLRGGSGRPRSEYAGSRAVPHLDQVEQLPGILGGAGRIEEN